MRRRIERRQRSQHAHDDDHRRRRRAAQLALQVSDPGITAVTLTPTAPIRAMDHATGAGNVPDNLRGSASGGVRGRRDVQPWGLGGIDLVHVSANGDEATFAVDDLDDGDIFGPGANPPTPREPGAPRRQSVARWRARCAATATRVEQRSEQ